MLTRLMEARLLAVACISVSVYSIPHLCRDCHLSHLQAKQKNFLRIQGSHQLQYATEEVRKAATKEI